MNGFPSVLKNGQIFRLTTRKLHDLSFHEARERIHLDLVSNKWTSERDEYSVMMKTLQQARKQGIWVPQQGGYEYKWGDKVYSAAKAMTWDLRLLLDIGVLHLSPQSSGSAGRTRLLINLYC